VVAPQVLDLNKIVTDLHKMLRRILREDIEPTLVLAPDLGRIRADPGQIEQVIMNLVVNARDAMESGGKLTIETENVPVGAGDASPYEGLPLGPRVMLAVSDTGCGIDEGARGQLFEPFFTTKERGKGTGLGLSTVYGVVKQCGGMISVQSEAQKGSTFRLYFPRALEQSTPPTPSVTPAAPATPPHETILVVEDEEALRKVAVRILQAEGYRVLSAANGAAALAIAERCCREIDLLLTDVVMPHMGGRQLAERLQTAIPTLRVLFMSGYSDNALSRDGVLESGTRLISKPFSRVDLAQSVRSALDEADGERCAANACFLR
jgi:CheY-like chemotaxis protein